MLWFYNNKIIIYKKKRFTNIFSVENKQIAINLYFIWNYIKFRWKFLFDRDTVKTLLLKRDTKFDQRVENARGILWNS